MRSLSEIKEEIKDRVDLSQVVSKHAKLVKTSGGYKACCPLPGHSEKSPSFNIDRRKNLYYCYGCQRGGDVFKFLDEVEGLSFMEALKELAEQLGIELPKATPEEASRSREEKGVREQGLEALQRSSQFFHYLLMNPTSPGAVRALEYLRVDRGLADEEIISLQLGWAPDSPDTLSRKLKDAGLLKVAEDAALVRNYSGRTYDFFQDRLMIPIRDRRSRVIAFSGRTLKPVDSNNPKYKNSPESLFFKKKEILYGLDMAIPLMNEKRFVCLVEGYFDQWAFQRLGVPAVAVMGTALTPEHLLELERFTKQIVLVLDADKAGIASTKRSLPLLLKGGWDTRAFSGLSGKDPDEWLKSQTKGVDEVVKLLKSSPEGLEWLILKTLDEARTEQLGRVPTLQRVKELWAEGVDSTHKELLLNQIAASVGLRVEELKKAFEEVGGGAGRQQSEAKAAKSIDPGRYEPFKDHSRSKNSWDRDAEELIVWWLRHWDELQPKSENDWDERAHLFEGSLAEQLVKGWSVAAKSSGQPVKIDHVSQQIEAGDLDPLLQQWLYRGLVSPESFESTENADKALISFRELAYSLKKEKAHAEIARLEQQLRSRPNEEEAMDVLSRIQMLRLSLEKRS
ncbi:MAG: DNA primase [Bdellovibrionota bacterium]